MDGMDEHGLALDWFLPMRARIDHILGQKEFFRVEAQRRREKPRPDLWGKPPGFQKSEFKRV
jgi:hypothetical protein